MEIDPDKARASFFKLRGRNRRAMAVVQRELLAAVQNYMNWRALDPNATGTLRAMSSVYSIIRVKRAMACM